MEVFGVQLKNDTSYKWQENHTRFMKIFTLNSMQVLVSVLWVHILLTLQRYSVMDSLI